MKKLKDGTYNKKGQKVDLVKGYQVSVKTGGMSKNKETRILKTIKPKEIFTGVWKGQSNNHVKNLEWCNHKYNCNYGTRNERMRKTLIKKYGVKVYIKELNLYFNCVKDCAKYLGIHSSNIFHQLKGRHNTCKGYKIIKEE